MRILLADDELNVRFALKVLIQQRPQWEIVEEAVDANSLLAQLAKECPDIVILDWLLPGLKKSGSLSALRQICPDLFVIAVSGRPELGEAALKAGADVFVSKIDPPERLLAAIAEFGEERIKNEVENF